MNLIYHFIYSVLYLLTLFDSMHKRNTFWMLVKLQTLVSIHYCSRLSFKAHCVKGWYALLPVASLSQKAENFGILCFNVLQCDLFCKYKFNPDRMTWKIIVKTLFIQKDVLTHYDPANSLFLLYVLVVVMKL